MLLITFGAAASWVAYRILYKVCDVLTSPITQKETDQDIESQIKEHVAVANLAHNTVSVIIKNL